MKIGLGYSRLIHSLAIIGLAAHNFTSTYKYLILLIHLYRLSTFFTCDVTTTEIKTAWSGSVDEFADFPREYYFFDFYDTGLAGFFTHFYVDFITP